MATVTTVRRIDELGRMNVPINILRAVNINRGDEVDVMAEDGKIILQKHELDNITADIKSLIHKYESDGTNINIIKALEKIVKEQENQ